MYIFVRRIIFEELVLRLTMHLYKTHNYPYHFLSNLDDTECSGGNFKQFQCTHAKSHCTRPICAGNRCIPHSWRNDEEIDCSDGSDEGTKISCISINEN